MAVDVSSADSDALIPDDARVEHLDVPVGPYNYHYMLAKPTGAPVGTVLLVHGWPDLGMAWRYQVPYLASLGYRVIVPDMLGYGRTSAPDDYREYRYKKVSGHLKALVEHVIGSGKQVIVGGHDWGAEVVWRTILHHPELVRAAFSLNVPYTPPQKRLYEGEALVKAVPTFAYQLQLASPEAERIIDASPQSLRAFINAVYGGVGPNGERAFSIRRGVMAENLDKIGPAALMSQELVDYYCREFSRHGFHGPTNWYRTRRRNWEDELPFTESVQAGKIKVPTLLVMGEKDFALPPRLADGMERWFEGPLRKELATGAGHWAMWQKPKEINRFIGDFLLSLPVEDATKKGKL